jgi:hypothetical protein
MTEQAMNQATSQDHAADRDRTGGMTRREVVLRVTALLGGAALAGGDRLLAFSYDAATLTRTLAQGTGAFTAADVALLDEIADTILPDTSTPGAKAAKVGAFMALMVTDVYTERAQQVFRSGLTAVDEACRKAHSVSFMSASPAQRLVLLEVLDREQKTAMEERATPSRSRAPAAVAAGDEPAPYFRMMKELALLGYFTSEIGYTRAMRYVEAPGRFDPCVPHTAGDKSWAPHA